MPVNRIYFFIKHRFYNQDIYNNRIIMNKIAEKFVCFL